MKRKVFYDLNQAHAYLCDTVIRFDGRPVYVHSIAFYDGPRDPYQMVFSYVGDRPINYGKALTNDPRLDITPVPLGLLSWPGENHTGWKRAAMVSRLPVRRWKWGLHHTNFTISSLNERFLSPKKADVITSAALRDTIIGKYPDYKTAFRLAKNHRDSIFAFNRNFAVSRNRLYYKTLGEVGSAGANGPELNDNHFYLQQVLEEERTW